MGATLIGDFPSGRDCEPDARAPTGEPFIVLNGGGFRSASAAEDGARGAFDKYAAEHKGVLYWRMMPSIERHQGGNWAFYMRLLISDKAAP